MEEIAFGEMGLTEQEFDSSTPRYFVRRANGMRAKEDRDNLIWNWRIRRLAYLTGQWAKGTTEEKIWPFPGERTTYDELLEARDFIEQTWGPIRD